MADALRELRSVADLRVGDHLCCVVESEEERRAVAAPLVRAGLARGEKVVCFLNLTSSGSLVEALRVSGVDPERHIASGQLVLLASEDGYLADGVFSPEAVAKRLKDATDEALAAGFPALRMIGEVPAALQNPADTATVVRSEALLHDVVGISKCLALCLYDRRRFAASLLLDVLRVHPQVAIGDAVHANPHFIAADQFFKPSRAEAELQGWLDGFADRRLAEAAVRSRARVLSAAPYAILVLGPQDRIEVWNEGAERTYGWTEEEALGQFAPTLLATVFPSTRTEIDAQLAATGEWRGELHHTTKDGRQIVVESGWSLDRAPEGGAESIVEINRDITGLMAARAAEQEIEKRYRSLFENMPSGVARCRIEVADGRPVDWTYLEVNQAFVRFLGMPVTPGQRVSEIIPGFPTSNEQTLERYGRVAAGGPPETFEVYVPALDVWAEVHLYSPAPGEFVSVFDLITERKRTEAALRRSREELAEAQRIAHVGSWSFDVSTGITEWSDEMFRIYGLPVGSPVPSREERARFHDADADAASTVAVARASAQGTPYTIELTLHRADGIHRHVVARGEPFPLETGAVAALRGTVTDVTELRDTQARLDQAQRAEMVGRLAGGIAHDFNNHLAAIGGYAELLASDLQPDDPRRIDLDAIEDAATRAGTLTRQLLAFGRRQALQPSALEPAQVVSALARMLRSLVPATIHLALPEPSMQATIYADRAGLEQAVVNLVLNARDVMSSGGTLSITVSEETVVAGDQRLRDRAQPGPYARISVRDTGIGIDPAVLPHIFEPFFTTKDFGRGSGLGLSSVEGFVAQSGGFIDVASEPGEGTEFAIYLPRWLEEPAQRQPSPVRPQPHRGQETILLVEDEPAVRAVTARLLTRAGYNVVEAADGDSALEMVDAGTVPNLLLTDVIMPGTDGRELGSTLRYRFPGLPTLYMSGYTADTSGSTTALPPGAALLAKPFSLAALTARVRQLLDEGSDPD